MDAMYMFFNLHLDVNMLLALAYMRFYMLQAYHPTSDSISGGNVLLPYCSIHRPLGKGSRVYKRLLIKVPTYGNPVGHLNIP